MLITRDVRGELNVNFRRLCICEDRVVFPVETTVAMKRHDQKPLTKRLRVSWKKRLLKLEISVVQGAVLETEFKTSDIWRFYSSKGKQKEE